LATRTTQSHIIACYFRITKEGRSNHLQVLVASAWLTTRVYDFSLLSTNFTDNSIKFRCKMWIRPAPNFEPVEFFNAAYNTQIIRNFKLTTKTSSLHKHTEEVISLLPNTIPKIKPTEQFRFQNNTTPMKATMPRTSLTLAFNPAATFKPQTRMLSITGPHSEVWSSLLVL
jgi:hypothetical protein